MSGFDLEKWARENRLNFESQGFLMSSNNSWGEVRSINIDSDKYVGTITSWPGGACEVQFNNAATGEVFILENINCGYEERLIKLFSEKLGLKMRLRQ